MKTSARPDPLSLDYWALIENIQAGVTVIGTDFRVRSVNMAQGAFFKKDPKTFVGRLCYEAFEKRRKVCPHCPGVVAMRTGKSSEAFTEGVRDDGTRFPVSIKAFPLDSPDGKPAGFLEFVEDLGGRERARQELGLQNALLRAQQEVSPDGILVVDGRGRMLSFNKRFVEMWGIPAAIAASRSDERALRHVLDKLVAPRAFLARVRHLYRRRRLTSREELALKDGRTFERHSSPLRGPDGAYHGRVWFFRDITERARAESALQDSEAKFRAAFEFATDPILWADARTGTILNCNQAAEKLLGRPRGEIIGRHQTSLHPPERRAFYRRHFRGHARAGTAHEEPAEVMSASGRRIPVSISARRLVIGGRDILQGIFRDITERAKAEESLRRSEERYRRIVETANEGIATLDRRFVIGYANDRFCRMLGYGPGGLAGRRLRRIVFPSDWKAMLRHMAARRLGRSETYEWRFRRKDGSACWCQVSGTPVLDDKRRFVGAFAMFTDITARKKAESELRASRQLYKNLAEGTPDFVYLLDTRGRVLYANRRLPQMPDPVGKGQSDLFPPAVARKHLETIRKVLRTGAPSVREETVSWPGKATVLENRLIPLRDHDGRITRLLGLSRDITRRKQAEDELRRSEERYRRFIDTSLEGFGSVDLRGRITSVNPRLERMFGYRPGSMLGLDVLRDLTQPEDRPGFATQLKARRRGASAVYEQRFRRKDGSTFWALVSGTPIRDGQGAVTGHFAMMTDITARKKVEDALRQSEERFKAIMESSSVAIALIRKEKIVLANKAFARLYGFRSPRDAAGASAFSLVAPGEVRRIREQHRRRMAGAGEVPGQFESVARRKDGTAFPVFVQAARIPLADGDALLGYITDITERRRAEDERRDLRARLVSSQETERKRLARELHDGVGQILSGVKFSLQALPKEIGAEPWKASEHVLKAASLLDRAIAEVRRVSQNLMPSELSDLGLQPALQSLLRRIERRSGLAVKARFSGLPGRLEADLSLTLYRIAQEALNNVERHARARSVEVRLRRSGGSMELSVSDDGKGCSPEGGPRRRRHRGLGLGNISERAASLGGDMEFDSKPNEGTRLLVRVPLKASA